MMQPSGTWVSCGRKSIRSSTACRTGYISLNWINYVLGLVRISSFVIRIVRLISSLHKVITSTSGLIERTFKVKNMICIDSQRSFFLLEPPRSYSRIFKFISFLFLLLTVIYFLDKYDLVFMFFLLPNFQIGPAAHMWVYVAAVARCPRARDVLWDTVELIPVASEMIIRRKFSGLQWRRSLMTTSLLMLPCWRVSLRLERELCVNLGTPFFLQPFLVFPEFFRIIVKSFECLLLSTSVRFLRWKGRCSYRDWD